MMKKILLSFLAALTIIMGGCSKEDDGTVVKPGNDTRPAWQAPANYADYEQFMSSSSCRMNCNRTYRQMTCSVPK